MIYQSHLCLLYNMDYLVENWISRSVMNEAYKSRWRDRSFSVSPGHYPSEMIESNVGSFKESRNDPE